MGRGPVGQPHWLRKASTTRTRTEADLLEVCLGAGLRRSAYSFPLQTDEVRRCRGSTLASIGNPGERQCLDPDQRIVYRLDQLTIEYRFPVSLLQTFRRPGVYGSEE